MARKKDNIRKLTRVGKGASVSVIIPAEILRSLGWREKQRVLVKRVPRGVLIEDARTKRK